ncbi:MAG: histidinol dehydrogenase [Bacteroidales bacterium]|nr:histidinol dehydrogenase [Bacteroidales bacterium]
MEIIRYPDRQTWKQLLKRPVMETEGLESTVAAILADIKMNGDRAVIKYTSLFDHVEMKDYLVGEQEFDEGEKKCSNELKRAILDARTNIEKFHRAQIEMPDVIETAKGVICWRKPIGIEKVGLYIPGGTVPLFSTLLMLGIPAKIAGCREIITCSPPGKGGRIHPAILFTARTLGLSKIFKIGGVQAIGAMAYGTETVPSVYKIFGPGNQYVNCAKQLIIRDGVAVDMPAGPSEVAILADESCIPEFVAADLLSQAEHGSDSHVLFVTHRNELLNNVLSKLESQIEKLPLKETALKTLKSSKMILVNNLNEGMDLINEYAPEHLILACRNANGLAEQVINAGSVFLGNYACESAGDYASGTNHTLPTNGTAKAFSGLSVDSFIRKITFQKITRTGIEGIGKTIEIMAGAEGLQGHQNAVKIRINH